MKCIRYRGSPEIHRVDDDVAFTDVQEGKAQYVPKQEWKRQKAKKTKEA